METPPVANTHTLYLPGMSIFSPVIPESVKRAIPRVLSVSSAKVPNSDSPPSAKKPKERRGLKELLGYHDQMTSVSSPDLFTYSHATEWPTSELTRPVTAISDDSDSAMSAMSSTVVDNTSMELARLDELMGSVGDRYEMDSGVRWNRVFPALSLLRNALYEARQPNNDPQLVRSLYTGALGYLLDALPADLSDDESMRIRGNIPIQAIDSHARTCASSTHGSYQLSTVQDPPSRSYVHRLLAAIIVYLFLFLRMLAPYAKSMAYHVYQFERSHRITQRFAIATIGAVRFMGQSGMHIGSSIVQLHEGHTGGAVSKFMLWWVENIAGGIYDGIGEGIALCGLDRADLWPEMAPPPMPTTSTKEH